MNDIKNSPFAEVFVYRDINLERVSNAVKELVILRTKIEKPSTIFCEIVQCNDIFKQKDIVELNKIKYGKYCLKITEIAKSIYSVSVERN